MTRQQSHIAAAKDNHDGRPQYSKFTAYQIDRPVTGQVQANQGGMKPFAENVTSGAVEIDRYWLHERAKAYQAKHPGTTYLNAVQAVQGA